MAVNIGPRIGVDGEEDYRKQMSQIIQQAKTLDSEMKAVTSSFTKNTTAQERDAATSKVLAAQIENQKKRVQMLAEMVEKSTAATGKDSVATLKWKQALNEAQASLNSMTNATEDAGEKASAFAENLKGSLTKAAKIAAAGLAAVTTAVAAIAKSALESYGDYEQLTGGVETLFKSSSDTVMEYANNAYKTSGLSANQYMETVTSFSASLLQSLGGDTEKAAKYADTAITDMADNANKMGTSMEAIQNAYQGFAKQNYTMLDNLKLGYGGTKQEMQRLLDDATKLTGIDYDISSYADIVDAIHAVQTEMGITGTTAKEASQTIQGSVAAAKSAWANLVTGLGDDNANLEQLTGNLVESVVTAGENIIPALEKILVGIGSAVQKLAPIISAQLPGIISAVVPSLLSAGASLLDGLIKGIVTALPQLAAAAAQIVPSLISTLLSPESITLLIDAALQTILALANGLIAALPELIEAVPVIISSLVIALLNNLPELLRTGVNIIGAVVQGLLSGLGSIISSVARIGDSIVDGFVDLIRNAATWGQDLIQNFINGIASKASALWDTVKGVAQGIRDFIGFSEPEKGPLSNFHTFAPDMMALFMQGIKDNQAQLQTTFSNAFDFQPLLDAPAVGATTNNTVNYGRITIPVYAQPGQNVHELANEIKYILQDETARREAVFR